MQSYNERSPTVRLKGTAYLVGTAALEMMTADGVALAVTSVVSTSPSILTLL
jgi:hypothetical protein